MLYAYTILYVPDVESTLSFYTKAFGFEQKFITPEKDYGELISGGTTIAFGSIELGKSNFKKGFQEMSLNKKPFGIELALTTETIEKDFQRALDHGATLYSAVEEKPWGQKVGYLRDLNGCLIEVCTPIKN